MSVAMFNRFEEVRGLARKETVCSFYFLSKRILILIDKTMCYFCILKRMSGLWSQSRFFK